MQVLKEQTKLKISSSLSLPRDAALWTFADLAIKGAGKTYAACVLAEEMTKAGIPIIAIDGLGIWWGLRVGVEGKEGLPVVVFGGSHKDIAIPTKSDKGRPIVDEERLKLMVKAILEARISAVLDTSEFSKGMQRRIVAVFVNELYHLNAPYGARHVFIEEADLWCPQKIVGDVAASAGAIDDLVRRGGNFNLGCTLISQRSAVVNKDVLTQASCLIVLRILHKLDKKAVQTWVEEMARPDDPRIKKWYDSLKDLKDGEAWVWHPQKPEIFERVKFRKRETLHATREYFRQAEFEQKGVRMTDVESFVQKFKAVFEPKVEAKSKTVSPTLATQVRSMKFESIEPNPLAPDRSFSVGLKVGANEGLEAAAKKVEEIDLEHKQTVIHVSHSENAVPMTTETQEGQAVFVLMEAGNGKELGIKEIFDGAAEHGWVIPYDTLRKAVLPRMVSKGLVIGDGHGNYRLPKFVRFDIKDAIAA